MYTRIFIILSVSGILYDIKVDEQSANSRKTQLEADTCIEMKILPSWLGPDGMTHINPTEAVVIATV